MSIFGISTGIPLTKRAVLTDALATAIIDTADRQNIVLVGILLVNNSGGSLAPVVDIYDGETALIIRDDRALADQAREVVELPEFLQIRQSDQLRVTAGAGLTVFASYITTPVSRG